MAGLDLDPESLTIDSIADEPAVPAERLSVDWLRYRFANPRPWTPEFLAEKPMNVGRNRWIPAAVLVPLVAHKDDDLWLMLTRRAAHLNDHAGQISFPGGRVDLTDSSRIETALREMQEEVGVERERIEVLGTLPGYRTGSGYSITPVVAIVRPPFTVRTDPLEVAEVFEVPLPYLMRGSSYERRSADIPELGRRQFYNIPYKNYMIWGATAGMLRNFFHFMRA